MPFLFSTSSELAIDLLSNELGYTDLNIRIELIFCCDGKLFPIKIYKLFFQDLISSFYANKCCRSFDVWIDGDWDFLSDFIIFSWDLYMKTVIVLHISLKSFIKLAIVVIDIFIHFSIDCSVLVFGNELEEVFSTLIVLEE